MKGERLHDGIMEKAHEEESYDVFFDWQPDLGLGNMHCGFCLSDEEYEQKERRDDE